MNELETHLHDALHAAKEHSGRGLSGPALRRTARRRAFRARTGGVAVVGAAAVAGVVVAPGLLDTPASRVTGAVQSSAPSPQTAATVSSTPIASPTAAPIASVAAKRSVTVEPVETPTAAQVWNPAGSLIDNATVLADAPKVASTDSDWAAWSKDYDEGPLLAPGSVHVVYAGAADIFSGGTPGPRPLVIVTGQTSENGPVQVAVLTSAVAAADPMRLDALGVEAIHPAAEQGPPAIAVYNGVRVYVAAETGVDSATFTYTDNTGTHTAPMTVTDGVAVAAEPSLDLKNSPNGAITNVKALSHGTVVWDAAPVAGR